MQLAIEDKREEPVLLDAIVYAHAPPSDDSRRLRLIQFVRPDGLTVLLFFTDRARAQFAARSAARIVELTGRQLMAVTRGATLMLNPNDTNCTLYPEEPLLATGAVGMVEQAELDESKVWIGSPELSPAWLVETLTELFQRLPSVETAYLVEMQSPGPDSGDAGDRRRGDAGGVGTGRPKLPSPKFNPDAKGWILRLNLTAFDPVAGPPQWLQDANVVPFYGRAKAH